MRVGCPHRIGSGVGGGGGGSSGRDDGGRGGRGRGGLEAAVAAAVYFGVAAEINPRRVDFRVPAPLEFTQHLIDGRLLCDSR